MPHLAGVPAATIESFRRQVEVIDHRGETSLDELRTAVAELAERDPGPFTPPGHAAQASEFAEIKPGGRRRDPLGYDPAGYFVISFDRQDSKIVVEHYCYEQDKPGPGSSAQLTFAEDAAAALSGG